MSAAQRPLIALSGLAEPITWRDWSFRAAFVPIDYVTCVAAVGGTGLIVPPDASRASDVAAIVDGLILTGGGDISPERYGAQPHPETGGVEPERDEAELALLAAADRRSLPVLAICRGHEILNVARGGTLLQHLPDAVGHTGHLESLGEYSEHEVKLDPAGVVARILGPSTTVRSGHHQAIERIGEGLTVTGWAPDGTVEAIEDPSRPFVVGVQWHPEVNSEDVRLFEALVEAARAAREGSG